MSPGTLEALCFAAHARRLERISLTMPADFRRPVGFPRGELLSINAAGEKNYSHDPLKLLAWLRSQWAPQTDTTHPKDAS